jgi:hypothetical protein
MKTKKQKRVYRFWRRHADLRQLVGDVVFAEECVERSLVDHRASPALTAALFSVWRSILGVFWERLYQVSPLRREQQLALDFSGDEPVIVIESDKKAGDATAADSGAGGEGGDAAALDALFSGEGGGLVSLN